jgi:hypothetical protein
MSDSLLVETARERGAEVQAALGRVLQEMQREGKLLVRMERSQTVYHITVARRFPTRRTTSPWAGAHAHGFSTTLMQLCVLSRYLRYSSGPLSIDATCVITNDVSSSPCSMRCSNISR